MINLKIKDKLTLKELQDLAEMMVIFKELTNHGVIFWSKKEAGCNPHFSVTDLSFSSFSLPDDRDRYSPLIQYRLFQRRTPEHRR